MHAFHFCCIQRVGRNHSHLGIVGKDQPQRFPPPGSKRSRQLPGEETVRVEGLLRVFRSKGRANNDGKTHSRAHVCDVSSLAFETPEFTSYVDTGGCHTTTCTGRASDSRLCTTGTVSVTTRSNPKNVPSVSSYFRPFYPHEPQPRPVMTTKRPCRQVGDPLAFGRRIVQFTCRTSVLHRHHVGEPGPWWI